jgi:hypothetical protein
MAITPSMEKVMQVNVWNHAQMHVRRAALAAIAGGIVGCTAHPISSTALDESPLADLPTMGLNSAGTLFSNARTDGGTLLFDGPNPGIRLANFDLSDPAVLRLPWVRAPQPLTPHIQSSWEFPDRTTDLLLTYYLDHTFDLTQPHERSTKARTFGTFMHAGNALYKMRQLRVESISAMSVVAFE